MRLSDNHSKNIPAITSISSISSSRAPHDVLNSLELVREILECQHFARLNFVRENYSESYVPYDLAIIDHARKQLDLAIVKFRELSGLVGPLSLTLDGCPQSIDIRSGLKSAMQLLRYRLDGVLVVEWLPSDLPHVFVDPDQFREMCYNLFLNSILGLEGRFGRITVEAIIQMPTRKWPGGVRIRFVDSGASVPADYVRLLFNPSFFIEQPRRVDGLLLYITKRLAEKNGGHVTAYTCFGDATAFCIDLPNSLAAA